MKFLRYSFLIVALAFGAVIEAKPFKRVLVISGGGVNPGLAVGIIAGVRSMGWKPDLIIASCGAGLGTVIYNSEQTIDGSFRVLTSEKSFETLNTAQIETANGIEILNKLDKAKNTARYPDIFENNLMVAPQDFPVYVDHPEFNQDPSKTKLILTSGRALFFPYQVGQIRRPEPMFQQVFFTDPETARLLEGWQLPQKYSYPYSTVMRETLPLSNVDTVTAMRAGIADPYLMNPSIVDGYFHFTGAIDLYPFDLAVALGDEVVATFPASLFLDYEDVAVNSAFGFKQTTRALEAIQHKDIKWIDISGADSVSFNPSRLLVVMRSGIPTDYMKYKLGVGRQWSFGHDRAVEAMKMAPGNKVDVRFHLRKPISPKLLEEFSCKNAFEWKTDEREFCVSDSTPNCDRRRAKTCVPIR